MARTIDLMKCYTKPDLPMANKFKYNTNPSTATVNSLYAVSFLCGCVITYLAVTFFVKQPTMQENNAVRKISSGKLIAPLLLGGDGANFFEDSVFGAAVSDYIKKKKNDGSAISVSVYFKNLTTGSWTGINENEHYAPASLMKVPVLIAVLKQAEFNPTFLHQKLYYDGKIDLNADEYYKPEKSIEAYHTYTAEELLDYMITYSDNNATALLLSITPKNTLTEIFTDLGIPIPSDSTPGTVDYLSDKLYSRLFRVLYNSTYLDEEYSEKALQLLTSPDFKNGISAKIPKNISVANKFGERTIYNIDGTVRLRELHDCGIVYLKKNPYLLCIMTKGNDFQKLEGVIMDISQIIYDKMNTQ